MDKAPEHVIVHNLYANDLKVGDVIVQVYRKETVFNTTVPVFTARRPIDSELAALVSGATS